MVKATLYCWFVCSAILVLMCSYMAVFVYPAWGFLTFIFGLIAAFCANRLWNFYEQD